MAADIPAKYVPAAEPVGHGRMSVFTMDIYDATLYTPGGEWQETPPFALQLSYLRPIAGQKIANRSIEEIRRQGYNDEVKLAAWHAQLREIFPDVGEGVSLTGIYTKDSQTIFYKGNREIGRIPDPEFGKYFFNIWLGKNTSAPDLRQKLLGRI
jgi:hypothetical protein